MKMKNDNLKYLIDCIDRIADDPDLPEYLVRDAKTVQSVVGSALSRLGHLVHAPDWWEGMSARCYHNVVERGPRVNSIEELASLSERELIKEGNIGKKTLQEIKDFLSERGYVTKDMHRAATRTPYFTDDF